MAEPVQALIEDILRGRVGLQQVAAMDLTGIAHSGAAVTGVNLVRACLLAGDHGWLQEALMNVVRYGARITAADQRYAEKLFPLDGVPDALRSLGVLVALRSALSVSGARDAAPRRL